MAGLARDDDDDDELIGLDSKCLECSVCEANPISARGSVSVKKKPSLVVLLYIISFLFPRNVAPHPHPPLSVIVDRFVRC